MSWLQILFGILLAVVAVAVILMARIVLKGDEHQ
jgi:hypothetical protein